VNLRIFYEARIFYTTFVSCQVWEAGRVQDVLALNNQFKGTVSPDFDRPESGKVEWALMSRWIADDTQIFKFRLYFLNLN
jgi:hypothetical protein